MPRRQRALLPNEKYLLLLLIWKFVLIVWAPSAPNLVPPNIYRWIEENAHICTIVPSNGEDLVNFLSAEEGLKCGLCPEVKPREVPTMACAVEVSPNDVDVEIGCHPIPELCSLELKNRYAEFYLGSPPGPEGPPGGPPGPPGGNSNGRSPSGEGGKRSEEEIFQATENVFSTDPKKLGVTEVNIDEEEDEETVIGTRKREEEEQEEVKEVFDILHGRGDTTSTTTTTTISPTMETNPLTTVRANIFSPGSPQGLSINLTLNENSAVRSRTSAPILEVPHGPPAGRGEMEMPMDLANGRGGDGTPLNMQKRVDGEKGDESEGEKSLQNCKDTHELCCFWAISGECESNPFWMRVKCPITCGTCGCKVKNADKCKSLGVKCVLPSTSTAVESTTTSSSSTVTSTPSTTSHDQPGPMPPLTTAQPRRRTRPTPAARMPGHRPQRPKHQRTSSTEMPRTLVDMTDEPLVSGKWTAVDYGDYADEEDEGPGALGAGSSVQPLFVVLSLSSTGYPDEALVEATDENLGGAIGTLDQTVPVEPAITSSESTPSSTQPSTTTARETCFNYHKLCEFWAKMGECSNNPFWMRPHCQRACLSCGETLGDISTPQPRPGGCNNEHILCPFWAFIGECGRNPRWMSLHCIASCQLC